MWFAALFVASITTTPSIKAQNDRDPLRLLGFFSALDETQIVAKLVGETIATIVLLDLDDRRIIVHTLKGFQVQSAPARCGESLVVHAIRNSDMKQGGAPDERYVLNLSDDLSSATTGGRISKDIASPLDLVCVNSNLYVYDLQTLWYRHADTGARLGGVSRKNARTLPNSGVVANDVVIVPLTAPPNPKLRVPAQPKGLLSVAPRSGTISAVTNSAYTGPYDVAGDLCAWSLVGTQQNQSILEVRVTSDLNRLVRRRVIDIRAERIWLTQAGQCAFVQGDGVMRLVTLNNKHVLDVSHYADMIRVAANKFVALDPELQKLSLVEVITEGDCCNMVESTIGNVSNFKFEELAIDVIKLEG